jgi:hypothetical protein
MVLDREDQLKQQFMMFCFLVLGFLHSVRGEFIDDVLETAVGPIFTGHE